MPFSDANFCYGFASKWPTFGRQGISFCVISAEFHLSSFLFILIKFIVSFFFTVSECLKYPDFSCVVSYKELIIGFAFLVPDYSHTEAYISYLFTHPEWRRQGIAKFMIYHLIQVTSD